MTDPEAVRRAEELSALYRRRWGREPELVCIPPGMTQEKLVVVLERIVDTGESILVGWSKCFLER